MSTSQLTPRPLRVLLVEDNPEDAFLLERHLRRNGFDPSIVRVETADQMVSELRSSDPPDVVLADYNLPEFSGPAALSLLKQQQLDIPFIMLSGAVTEEIAVSSMRAGAADYVTKQNLARLVPALERELNELAGRRREKAAQRALRASENRFDRLVAAMPLGLLISDAENRIVYANGALESILRYDPGSLREGSFRLENVFSDRAPFVEAMEGFGEPGRVFESHCRVRTGGTVEVLVGVTVLNPEGSASNRQIAVFVADLTLQKKSEETLRRTEKLAVAGRLAAAIAHEINNPLAALTNCLYLIAQSELPTQSRQLLQAAQSELDRVSQITVQTLRFHRSSTHARRGDLHELIETVLTLLKPRFMQQGIEVVRDFQEIPQLVMHEGEIRQLIANLIGNSIDALPRGGCITLRTREFQDLQNGQREIRLTVADNGIGMDPVTRSRVFEPFFSTKGITGTGLGLWISREIVAKHGGRIRQRSRRSSASERGGTVFTIFLPLETSPASLEPVGATRESHADTVSAA